MNILPKYCQPNLIKRLFGILSEGHCLYCQYARGLGCKLYIDENGKYKLRMR